MRHLGIDYGEKRVGIAVSDEGGAIAFPYAILEYGKALLGEIKNICIREHIEMIVVGDSKNYQGEPNRVREHIDKFVLDVREAVSAPIVLEWEFLSTQQARFHQKDLERVDDSAAAIILQSYLDRKNNRPILETL